MDDATTRQSRRLCNNNFGRTATVREFIEISALKLGWNKSKDGPGIIWNGKGTEEIGIRADTNEVVIKIDKRYFRPTEVDSLLGDPSKSYKELGWVPNTTLEELVEEMMAYDLKKLEMKNIKLFRKFIF